LQTDFQGQQARPPVLPVINIYFREIVNSKRVDFIEMLVEYFDEVVPKYGCKELQSLHPVLIELDLVHLYDKIEPHLLAHWEYKRKSLEGIRKIGKILISTRET